MPHFVSKESNFLITSSFKCGYSTFHRNDNFVKISTRELCRLKKSTNGRHFMVCRNPYDRVESMFRDKFRKVIMKDNYELQDVHFKIRDKLNLNSVELRPYLLNVNFEQFVLDILPKVINVDLHFRPQIHSKRFYYYERNRIIRKLGIYRSFSNVVIIKLENDMELLSSLIGINVHTKVNTSSKHNGEIYWNDKMLEKVNSLYREDFKFFAYDDK